MNINVQIKIFNITANKYIFLNNFKSLFFAINGLQTPINQALYPFISKNKDLKLFKKIYLFAVILNILICTFMFIFAKEFIILFYGANMVDAYKVLRIFCIGSFIVLPHVLLGYPLLGALGHTKEANMSVIVPSITHIIGLFILFITGNMNIYSIACMAVFTEYFVFTLRAYWVWKYKLLNKEECFAK